MGLLMFVKAVQVCKPYQLAHERVLRLMRRAAAGIPPCWWGLGFL